MTLKRRNSAKSDYALLQEQSIAMIQQLAGNQWTDYNEHDPGVTLLDSINYALLELKYRLGFDFSSYLADPLTGQLDLEEVGLKPASEVLAPAVVTPSDYEQLIKQEISGITACNVRMVDGHYRVRAVLQDPVLAEQKRKEITQLYHRNRNLCENLMDVSFDEKASTSYETSSLPAAISTKDPKSKSKAEPQFSTTYHSIQYDLPNCYGINEQGAPAGVSKQHRAQLLQLRAYLLLYDYMLSGTIQQIGQLHTLMHPSGAIPEPFDPQLEIADLDKLLDRNRLKTTEVFETASMHRQKATFFDLLNVIYGEDVQAFHPRAKHIAATTANQWRATLSQQLVDFNRYRFRAADLTDQQIGSLPTIKQTIEALLGDQLQSKIPKTEKTASHSLKILADQAFFEQQRKHVNVEVVYGQISKLWKQGKAYNIPHIALRYEDSRFKILQNHISLIKQGVIFESFLQKGMDPTRYKAVQPAPDKEYTLYYHQPEHNRWIKLGSFTNKNLLIETTNILWDFLYKFSNRRQSFYIVEHILLLTDEGKPSHNHQRLTIVLPQHMATQFGETYLIELFECRLPAHLDVQYRWLETEGMKRFEDTYFKWKAAWAKRNPRTVIHFSTRLLQLL